GNRALPRLAGLDLDDVAEFALFRTEQRGCAAENLTPLGSRHTGPGRSSPRRSTDAPLHIGLVAALDVPDDSVVDRRSFFERLAARRSELAVVYPVEDAVGIH